MDREGGQQDLLMGPFLKRQIYFTLSLISKSYPDLLEQMKLFEAIPYPLLNNQLFPI